MAKPVLVVMAAGMGSRYGGLKQIDPITEQGEIIIDFSLYDAMLAGFEDVVFIIKHEIEEDVRALIDNGAGKHLNIRYAFQELDDLPPGYALPEGRVKPWGTSHAILAARGMIEGNFAAINADDYYGAQAYRLMYEELLTAKDTDRYDYSMIGYRLANTLTEHGHVTRGVCATDNEGRLAGVDERMKIMWREDGEPHEEGSGAGSTSDTDRKVEYEDEDGTWHEIQPDAIASMNFWGFTPSFMKELSEGFPAFLDDALKTNPMKAEYLLPREIDTLLKNGRATVKIIPTDERWFGVTYKEDKEHVEASVRAMRDRGLYPETLW